MATAKSRQTGVQYYGGNIPIIYVVKGEGDPDKFTFHRTVKDHIESVVNGKKDVKENKKPKPDGPNPKAPFTKITRSCEKWEYTNLDLPAIVAPKSELPALKKATYRFWVEDKATGKVVKEKSVEITIEIDAQGKVTFKPSPNAEIKITPRGGTYTPKKP